MRGAHHRLLLLMCILLSLSGVQTQKTGGCPRWPCPKNSVCVDERSCRCKPGFTSSGTNGHGLIMRLIETCEDINECLQPGMSTICGSFAMCQNSEGSYYCICNLGYKLRSGEISFANKSENTCEASVDSGVTPAPSGIHTVTAAPGSLPKQPATVHPWTQPGDPGEKTPKDVNECTSGQNRCHPSTHCINKLGNYSCNCRHGWKPVLGSPNGPINTVCEGPDATF